MVKISEPEERFEDGSHNHQENAAPEPGCGDLAGIMVAVVPFLIDLDCADQSKYGANCIHEVGACVEITADCGICLVDPCIAVSSLRVDRCTNQKQECRAEQRRNFIFHFHGV